MGIVDELKALGDTADMRGESVLGGAFDHGKAAAYKHAGQLVEAADLIPRAEVVAWLQAEGDSRFADLEAGPPQAATPAVVARRGAGLLACSLANAIKAGNPWEAK